MKGKNTFTAKEISYLKQLIRMRVNADRDDQKKIRRIMRSIGFYGSDYGIVDCQVSDLEGLYCIKLRKGVRLPAKFGKVRENGVIYIGQASTSLNQRLWKQELNHHGAATFFRSIGAMLGYLPPKGSLVGKSTRNYRFSSEDTEAIRNWIRQSLLVNFVVVEPSSIDDIEEALIREYCPLVNIAKNPAASAELSAARDNCVAYAKSK